MEDWFSYCLTSVPNLSIITNEQVSLSKVDSYGLLKELTEEVSPRVYSHYKQHVREGSYHFLPGGGGRLCVMCVSFDIDCINVEQ